MTRRRPVIPNFGQGSSCVTGDHAFCWDWVHEHWGDTLGPALVAAHRADGDRGRDRLRARVRARAARAPAAAASSSRSAIVSALLYTIPSLALFQLLVPFTGITRTTVEIALVAYTLVILFPNILAGLRSAPPDVLEAARGMGLTRRQVLMRVELPLAVPAIIGGLRIAVVSTISIATIAAFLLPEGLGYPIFLALKRADAVQDRDLLGGRARRRARARVRPAARRAPARCSSPGAAHDRSPTPPTRTRSSTRSGSSATTRASSRRRRSSSSSSRRRRSAIALVVALPLGIVLGHLHRGSARRDRHLDRRPCAAEPRADRARS